MAFPNGPLAGGNLLLVMIDRLVQLNPEGQPTSPPNSRYAVLAGLAAPDAGGPPSLFVYRIFASDMSANPYSNSVAAEVARSSATTGPANGGRTRTESWAVSYDGGTLALELSFVSGKAGWGPAEAFPHSAVNPDFSRIYRYDQLVDLAMSTAVGKPLDGTVSLSSSIPELTGIFNGAESLVAIMDVPVYTRQVFLP
ncbi:hypothetical protein KB874_09515 [Aestuariicoccus sp. KMU-90]|uniref:Uncharacterized protein n=2 Tax=Thetidibacter halocola TaxID=2827239 RepID=A0A8J7WB91_9RHOB|nr:hypothetical protein [Thetidibacter halocola]